MVKLLEKRKTVFVMSNKIENIKKDLERLVEQVQDPDISLEQALDTYNEAIELSLKATAIIEDDSEISKILKSADEQQANEEPTDSSEKTEQESQNEASAN